MYMCVCTNIYSKACNCTKTNFTFYFIIFYFYFYFLSTHIGFLQFRFLYAFNELPIKILTKCVMRYYYSIKSSSSLFRHYNCRRILWSYDNSSEIVRKWKIFVSHISYRNSANSGAAFWNLNANPVFLITYQMAVTILQ